MSVVSLCGGGRRVTTPCAGPCLGMRRAALTLKLENSRGEVLHRLDLCEACARHPFVVVRGTIVEVAEMPAHERQVVR